MAFTMVVLASVAAVGARSSSGAWFTVWVSSQIVTTGLAWLIPEVSRILAGRRERSAEEREEEARADTRIAMNDALDPVVRLLGQITVEYAPTPRTALRAKSVPFVLNSAVQLIGPDRARACWFEITDGPPVALLPVDAVGRSGVPRTRFEDGTAHGNAALAMVRENAARICQDVALDPPPGWDPGALHDYRTFISVSVIAGDVAYGMLSLDSLEPGDLTVDDMKFLRLLAGLLAVALEPRGGTEGPGAVVGRGSYR